MSPTFLEILNDTKAKRDPHWYKTLNGYYYRDQWELYNVKSDINESVNLAHRTEYKDLLEMLKKTLLKWQKTTCDPWICSPGGVLENTGAYKHNPQCLPLYNDL